MVVRHKVKREVVLWVHRVSEEAGTIRTVSLVGAPMHFPNLAAMDRFLDTQFQPPEYLVGSVACYGGERYEVLAETESAPEPWQRRAAIVRKVGLGFWVGGWAWLAVGLCLAPHGGLAILGRPGFSLACLGGVLYGAAWLAGHPLSTAAIEKRVAKWADGVARTVTLRWRWKREDASGARAIEWRGLQAEVFRVGRHNAVGGAAVAWGWFLIPWSDHDNLPTERGPFPGPLQAMRAAEEWLWSQAREAGR